MSHPSSSKTEARRAMWSLCFRLLRITVVLCLVTWMSITLASYLRLRYSPMGEAIGQGVGKQITIISEPSRFVGAQKREGQIKSVEMVWDGLEPKLSVEWEGTIQLRGLDSTASGSMNIAADDLPGCYIEGGTSRETESSAMMSYGLLDTLGRQMLIVWAAICALYTWRYRRSRLEHDAPPDSP
jgi:hypothetical protein